MYRESLAICEKTFGPRHPEVATRLSNLAELHRLEGQAINRSHSIAERSTSGSWHWARIIRNGDQLG